MNLKRSVLSIMFLILILQGVPVSNADHETETKIYRADVLGVPVGSIASGNITSTHYVDGNYLNISETVGSPAYEVHLNYTLDRAVTENNVICARISGLILYDGSPSHVVHLEAFNFTSGSWYHYETIISGSSLEWVNVSTRFGGLEHFVNNDGEIWLGIDHETAGNINHLLTIDYLAVEITFLEFFDSGVVPYYASLRNPIINDKWISANQSAWYNDSEKAYMLLWDPDSGTQRYENLTTYTEVDVASNKLTVWGPQRYTVSAVDLDEQVYLYYNYSGSQDFSSFAIRGRSMVTAHIQNGQAFFVGLSNQIGDEASDTGDLLGLRWRWSTGDAHYQLSFVTENNTAPKTVQTYEPASQDTWYYYDLLRSGSNFTANIYTDFNRTNRVAHFVDTDTFSVSDTFTIIYAMRSVDIPLGGRGISFDSRDLRFRPTGGYKSEGYIYSTNLFENITETAYMFLMNFTLPGFSKVQIDFSSDNNTWVGTQYFDNGLTWSAILLEPYLLNPLYVRFRLNSTTYAHTPFIWNYEILYRADCNGGNMDAWSINWLLSIIWLVIMGIGVFKPDRIIRIFAGFFGLILGVMLLSESPMVSIALICLNLYLIYEGSK